MAIRDEDKKNTPNETKNIHENFNERVSMGNNPDPTAKRNVGKDGDLQRGDQKDDLKNLHIQGSEASGYGANDSDSPEAYAQGPGFEYEGSETAMDDNVNGVRSSDQPLGSDEASDGKAGDPSRL